MSSRAFQRATADPVAVANAATPPGAIAAFAFGAAPTGWLKANGAAVSRATYSALFAAVGTTFGAGDGSTTFNLPDLRGEFVRGHDDGRGVDAGRTLGSAQAADVAPHSHTASTTSVSAGTPSGSIASGGAHTHSVNTIATSNGVSGVNGVGGDHGTGTTVQSAAAASDGAHNHTFTGSALAAHTHSVTVNNSTGAESRPRNVAALYCIKA